MMNEDLLKDKILEYLRNTKTKYQLFKHISRTFGLSIEKILHILYEYKHTVLENDGEDNVIICMTFKDNEATIFYNKSSMFNTYSIEIRENFCADLVYEEHKIF